MDARQAKTSERKASRAGAAGFPARRRGGPWIALPWIALAPLAAACGGAPTDAGSGETTASTGEAIYAGVADNDTQANAAVVALEIGDPTQTSFTLCSGVLVAADVVLTARHCVSVQLTTATQCDQNGNTLNGANFGADQPLANVRVFVGPGIYQNEAPAASAKALFHPAGTTLCNGDLALVQLDRPITTVAPMRVRMKGGVTAGETVRAVGFGQNDQNQPIGTRFRKDGVAVLAVGSTVSSSQTPLGSNEFELGESTCGGDSGGPAIDETTGAVVGIVSRANSDCTLAYGHVFTSLAGLQPVFQQAFAAAGGNWYDESGPQPTVPSGSSSGGGGSPDGGQPTTGGSSGGGSGGSSGGGNHYGGPPNLEAGKGAACSVAAVGASSSGGDPAEIAATAAAAALLALAMRARRRIRA